jgi:hypothetical protein
MAATPDPAGAETSSLGRIIALITPFFAALAASITAWVAKHIPGVQLDSAQITALMVAVATSALGAAWKWLTGWQQHERLVAQGLDAPVKTNNIVPPNKQDLMTAPVSRMQLVQ